MKKNIVFAAVIVLFVCLALFFVKIQSVEDYYLEHIDDIKPDSKTVTLSIRCDTVLQNLDSLDPALREGGYIPEDGVILPPTQYVLRDGDTAFDILLRAAKHNHIQLEYKSVGKTLYNSAYIEGINYLYEFSCGELSGWMYAVDGEFPDYGSSQYVLEDGQTIEWLYTCSLGEDLGAVWRGES